METKKIRREGACFNDVGGRSAAAGPAGGGGGRRGPVTLSLTTERKRVSDRRLVLRACALSAGRSYSLGHRAAEIRFFPLSAPGSRINDKRNKSPSELQHKQFLVNIYDPVRLF